MSGSLNRVELIGNLGKDVEVRTMNNGKKVVNLRIATSESWRDKNTGERQEKTEWHTVVIFNEALAKVAEDYLKKGAKIYISGQLQTRKWQDQQGQDRYSTEVVINNYKGELVMLSRTEGDDGNRPAQGTRPRPQPGRTHPPADDDEFGTGPAPARTTLAEDLDDEIPF